MSMLREFFSTNQIIVVFGYGLVYFLLGFALTLHSRRPSELTVARALPLLGTFGILHGVADGAKFHPDSGDVFVRSVIVFLWAVQGTLLAVAFTFLLQFGLRLVSEGLPRRFHHLPALAWAVFTLWFVTFVLGDRFCGKG